MFVDTSVVVAIFSGEEDAGGWSNRIEAAPVRITSALVVLEAAMRLSTMLAVQPVIAGDAIAAFLREAEIEIVPIDARDAVLAVQAFSDYGKGRGHPAQLNLADCLSYACAKSMVPHCSTRVTTFRIPISRNPQRRHYFPSSIDRSRAASTASASRCVQPVVAHQHRECGGRGAVGAGHLLAQHGRVFAAFGGERGGAVDRLHGQQPGGVGWQPGLFGRRGQASMKWKT